MALKLIGIGVKCNGKKEVFTVSERTSRAGLEGIMSGYARISAIAEPNKSQSDCPGMRGKSPDKERSLTGNCRQQDSIIVDLLESGKIDLHVLLSLRSPGQIEMEPDKIESILEQLKAELGDEEKPGPLDSKGKPVKITSFGFDGPMPVYRSA